MRDERRTGDESRTHDGTRLRGDDRAVSFSVGYALNLAVAAIVLAGLLVAAGGVVETQRETVVREELDVLGHQLAVGTMETDRLARVGTSDEDETGESPRADVRVSLPSTVAGTGYSITVRADELELEADDPAVSVTVPLVVETDVTETTVRGGPLDVEYDGSGDGSLVVSES
ncbi:DUF7266 family protein [Halegenticoccus tardaugens]|uniref:DUF7266 family protein n=1 Tax=Halegenticoccus tardaugens TaxID=2071624 RepID=UPI00100A879A|nr:hypothetical protein [Halegenticoccus tardaugens]